MPKLHFKDFADYESKLKAYLQAYSLTTAFEEYRIDGIEYMINNLSMQSARDVDQLAFLMWMLPSDFKVLLNERRLLSKLTLDTIANKLKVAPEMKSKEFRGFTPLGGWTLTSNDSIQYYNCLKFIG